MSSLSLLRLLLPSTVKGLRKHIHTTPVYKIPEVWQPDKRGRTYNKIYDKKSDEEKFWEEKSVFEKIEIGLKLFKREFKVFIEEIKDGFRGRILFYRRGEVDVFWRFSKNPECLEKWIVTCDSDNDEGYSTAKLELSPHGTGIFSGNLDMTVPKDGEVTQAGYCNLRTVNNVKSFLRETPLDWSPYTHLRVRVRGDGRFYIINIGTKQTFDVQWFQIYHFLLMTRGGPYWQDIKIPFSKFFLAHKGRVQDRQYALDTDSVLNIGFMCADKIPGSFKLEIDYIGVECDSSHTEEFAYENYAMETMKL